MRFTIGLARVGQAARQLSQAMQTAGSWTTLRSVRLSAPDGQTATQAPQSLQTPMVCGLWQVTQR